MTALYGSTVQSVPENVLRNPFEVDPTYLNEDSHLNMDDNKRSREVLENHTLDSLKMVGTIERQNELYALVKDNQGFIHRVTKGNYIGLNNGKIENIDQKSIEITETKKTVNGLMNHSVTLHLK